MISIGNSTVSSAIWKKHARVSFSKTIEIESEPIHERIMNDYTEYFASSTAQDFPALASSLAFS